MNWTSVQSIIERSSAILIHSIINFKEPAIIAAKMNIPDIENVSVNPRITRISGPSRLGSRPKGVGRTKLTRYHFRSAAYQIYAAIPDEITSLKTKKNV